jgi:hypothetical protein
MKINMLGILDKAKPDRKYKRLKLGGGQVYNRSSDWTTVVAEAARNTA